MSDIFLGLIAIGELVAFAFYVHETNKEKAKLTNALIAKDAQEMTNLTFADNTKIEPSITSQPELLSTDQMTDEQFEEHIQEEIKNG